LGKQPPRLSELFDTMLLELQGSDKADKKADPMTNLGGQTLVMLALVGIKFWAQCCGVDSPNEGEISNKDTYKLHDAFNYPFQKMMGQGTQIIVFVAIVDLLNVNILKSDNLAMIILTGFITFTTWVCMGAYYVYRAQKLMKQWYEYELVAHDEEQLEKLHEKYAKIY